MENMDAMQVCHECPCCQCDYHRQKHVHEVLGSVMIAERDDPHNHRFATISGEAIPLCNGDHVHEVRFRTDFYENHYHEFCGTSGGAIDVGGGRHVHFIESQTNIEDRHLHCFRVAFLIENPIGD